MMNLQKLSSESAAPTDSTEGFLRVLAHFIFVEATIVLFWLILVPLITLFSVRDGSIFVNTTCFFGLLHFIAFLFFLFFIVGQVPVPSTIFTSKDKESI